MLTFLCILNGQESNILTTISSINIEYVGKLLNNSALPYNDPSEVIIQNALDALKVLKNIGEFIMTGTQNLINSIPEEIKNSISNITSELSSNNFKEGLQSLYLITSNVTTQNGSVDYQKIASEWILQNPNLNTKITSLIQLLDNKIKTLPSTYQNYISNWTQTHPDVIQQISEGKLNEDQLNEITKESLVEFMAIPEDDRRAFNSIVPGLGTLFVDPTFLDKIKTAINSPTKESLKENLTEISKFIFSRIFNFMDTPTTTLSPQ
uniref:Opaque-phase-specific protein OP4 n=1 Tax=Strongyloides venezuelensis TaxID=75913 RepID=A0A0K0FEW1_STRVS